jgi:hypothetical protein
MKITFGKAGADKLLDAVISDDIGHICTSCGKVCYVPAVPAESQAEMGTCDLVSRPHRRDHCGEAWRPLAAQTPERDK